MSITPGKLAGLRAVSDARGVIAAAAMDQRGSLKKSLAKEKGVAELPDSALVEFKELVTEVLTKHASAILLDPEYGLPAAQRRNGKGLLLAYEKTGYDSNTPGRLPDLLDVWSVRRLKEAGADAIKILLYYTPYERTAINDHKHAWTERIGDECVAHDIPFFLELVGYDAHGGDEKGLEYAKKKPEIVSGSMSEFGKAKYNVDVLKVEVPVQMEFVHGTKSLQGRDCLHPRRGVAAFPRCCVGHSQAHSSIFRLESRTRSSSRRSHSQPRAARRSTECSAAAPHGKTESPSTPRKAQRRLRTGSTPRASKTSTTSIMPSNMPIRGSTR